MSQGKEIIYTQKALCAFKSSLQKIIFEIQEAFLNSQKIQ